MSTYVIQCQPDVPKTAASMKGPARTKKLKNVLHASYMIRNCQPDVTTSTLSTSSSRST